MLIAEHSVKLPLAYHFKKIYGENQQEYLALTHYAVTKANQKKHTANCAIETVKKNGYSLKSGTAIFSFYLLPTVFVATRSTPVPAMSARMISPRWTGAWTAAVWIASIHSRIFPLGMSAAVLTETMGMTPFFTGTLLVTVRTGFVHSFSP